MNFLFAAKLFAALIMGIPNINFLYAGRLKFTVTWTIPTGQVLDSVVVYARSATTLSGLPYRKSVVGNIIQDSFYIALPNDSTTIIVELKSYRGGKQSIPSQSAFLFNPTIMIKVTKLIVKLPITTLVPAQTSRSCAFIQFNDSTVVLRTKDQAASECVQIYTTQFAIAKRQPTQYQQNKANTLCVLWSAVGAIIQPEVCQ